MKVKTVRCFKVDLSSTAKLLQQQRFVCFSVQTEFFTLCNAKLIQRLIPKLEPVIIQKTWWDVKSLQKMRTAVE